MKPKTGFTFLLVLPGHRAESLKPISGPLCGPKVGFNFRTFWLHFWAPRLAKNAPLSPPENEQHMPQTTAQFAQLKGGASCSRDSPHFCLRLPCSGQLCFCSTRLRSKSVRANRFVNDASGNDGSMGHNPMILKSSEQQLLLVCAPTWPS